VIDIVQIIHLSNAQIIHAMDVEIGRLWYAGIAVAHHHTSKERAMRYKILAQKAGSMLMTDFERAAQELSNKVNEALRDGWEPQGGLAVGRTTTAVTAYLMQAVVKQE
jgi:hypothetical protein